ncbi:MAG: SH3 domain-containing protein [Clostridia bacterium]|nr:SH3 domain-containing protein [Clostridia bacterium]
MAKKLKFKPTPAGILFLSAIGVLLIAIIILTVIAVRSCGNKTPDPDKTVVASQEPVDTPEPVESVEPSETPAAVDPGTSIAPDDTTEPETTPVSGETSGPGSIVITTPGSGSASASASPAGTTKYYTSPTSTMKKNAQKGYVSADKVNMRKEPNAKAKLVKEKIPKNTSVTLYVEQEGWWFLKCGDKYGYIRKDFITKGSAPTASTSSSNASGKVVASKIALRKSADETSECIKEYANGEQLTIYWSEKGKDGKKWYYVKTSDGKKGYMFAEYVKVTSGKVTAK